ncbi:MAG: hypothetical protein PHD51_01385 [Patescibacteria group bacterium]|nr:hypothetical protein [Patescibacteria group bacterium]MDD5490486.1 hypothetical protein [Patescibacteria group bacterium]
MNFFGKYFKITTLTLLFIELLSFLGYLFTPLNHLFFFLIIIITLILSLRKPEYGIFILLGELFVGSKGYLFFFEYNGIIISLRIALFLVVMSVWFWQLLKTKKILFRESKLFWPYILIFLAIGWGIVNGLLRNEFSAAFFDANAWVYFALIFPFYEILKNKSQFYNLLQIFFAATIVLSLKTFTLLYIFSHNLWEVSIPLYHWVRNSGVGEITFAGGNFYRIFIQSQIFVLVGIFITAVFIAMIIKKSGGIKVWLEDKNFLPLILLFISYGAVIIISFSRSFWLGGAAAGILFLPLLFWLSNKQLVSVLKSCLYFILLLIISFGLVYTMANFPYPKVLGGFSASLFGDRFTNLSEAGASSRWQLLPELWKEIKKNPIAGEGFGAAVTYKTSDPRILETTADGLYTTSAFEWGYLDIWLKLGFFGLAIYLLLLYKISKQGFVKWKGLKNESAGYLILGTILGLIAIIGTNFFSPYLNHPLGIGYLILCSSLFESAIMSST